MVVMLKKSIQSTCYFLILPISTVPPLTPTLLAPRLVVSWSVCFTSYVALTWTCSCSLRLSFSYPLETTAATFLVLHSETIRSLPPFLIDKLIHQLNLLVKIYSVKVTFQREGLILHSNCFPSTASHALSGSAQISQWPILPSSSNPLSRYINCSSQLFPVFTALNLAFPTTLTAPFPTPH